MPGGEVERWVTEKIANKLGGPSRGIYSNVAIVPITEGPDKGRYRVKGMGIKSGGGVTDIDLFKYNKELKVGDVIDPRDVEWVKEFHTGKVSESKIAHIRAATGHNPVIITPRRSYGLVRRIMGITGRILTVAGLTATAAAVANASDSEYADKMFNNALVGDTTAAADWGAMWATELTRDVGGSSAALQGWKTFATLFINAIAEAAAEQRKSLTDEYNTTLKQFKCLKPGDSARAEMLQRLIELDIDIQGLGGSVPEPLPEK